MSRKGKIPVAIPPGVKVKIANGSIQVEGSKGKISLNMPMKLEVEQNEESLVVSRRSDDKHSKFLIPNS